LVAGDLTRGGVARGSPEFIAFDAPGVKSSGFWVQEVHHATCDSPEHYTRLENALEHGCDGGGGTAQRRSSACIVPAAGTTYDPLELAQQDQGDNAVLTEGSGRAELQRGWPATRTGGGDERRSWRKVMPRWSSPLGCGDWSGELLWRWSEG
jgi:hypothetical protein